MGAFTLVCVCVLSFQAYAHTSFVETCTYSLSLSHTHTHTHTLYTRRYFRLDPAGESVFDLGTWNQIFETLLRAKCNMIIPGTSPNPDEGQIALANRRGLVVSQSHFEIVNFGAFMWLDGDVAPRELCVYFLLDKSFVLLCEVY